MANIPMKTLRLHGLDDTYTIPTAPEHIGAAPAGYGLGERATSYDVASETELNAVLTNMLSKLPDRSVGFFICNDTTGVLWTGGAMHVTVYKRDAQYSCARFDSYGVDGAVSLQKSLYNYVWSPLEWFNPPMIPGVIYRTTKRHNGKPVYTALIHHGKGSSNGTFHIYLESIIGTNIIFTDYVCKAQAANGWNLFLDQPTLTHAENGSGVTRFVVTNGGDLSNHDIYLTVEFYYV